MRRRAAPDRAGSGRGAVCRVLPGGSRWISAELPASECPHCCRVAGAWQRLPRLPAGTAVLLFGICTAWRSNDRIPAAEHRVADEPALLAGAAGVTPRRLSAVLFMGESLHGREPAGSPEQGQRVGRCNALGRVRRPAVSSIIQGGVVLHHCLPCAAGLCDSATLAPAVLAPGEEPRYRQTSVGSVQPTVSGSAASPACREAV